LVGAGPVALGDWDEGDGHKMHYPQLPDLTTTGMDVYAMVDSTGTKPALILADDFLCAISGPITDIHIWGSWYFDNLPGGDPYNVVFTLSFHADIPASQSPTGYSMPGPPLWWRTFGPGEFTVRQYATIPGGEWWYEPFPDGQVIWPADWTCWQYNFYLEPGEFIQEEGTIYWLNVQAQPQAPYTWFGWKTTSPEYHWNDDACWVEGVEPYNGNWNKLTYPGLHPYEGSTVDMAFVITGGVEEAELDHGDAPEGDSVNPVIAYPSLGVMGRFPTCLTIFPPGAIQHGLGWARFEPAPGGGPPGWDPEPDGDAGLCPPPGCFPTYDDDECYADLDAGLMFPEPYTIDSTGNVVTCPQSQGTALGYVCNTAVWGQDIDIWVVNTMPVTGYVNVLMDWKQDGFWSGVANCIVAGAPEHVLVDWPVPVAYQGPLSGLMPVGTGFLIGPNSGYVWSRFSITEREIMDPNWDGSGIFEDGETEDYLIRVDQPQADELDFGDAPDGPYPTKLPNGARHVIQPRIYLGSGVDAENDGQPHPQALGDDNDGNDDEDGVVFTSPLMPGTWATVDVNSNAIGALDAWVDFGGDGSWAQPVDQIFTSQALVVGINPLVFWVPFGAQPGTTFARFRFSTGGGLSYTGQASDGEVEDYMVDIKDNPAIKWIQLPDATPNGIDIKVTGQWLADDFECTSSGLITDVHLFGSWLYDEIGEITNVHLSFHSDDPCGSGGYSEPNELLWEKDLSRDEFYLTPVMDLPDGEWWWDPVEGTVIPSGDLTIWRIDIYIDPDEAFIQKGDPCNPVTYWLDVRVDTEFGEFGWKTRQFPEHYKDDAVFHWGELPFLWKELRYPPDHPYHANSIDMAFVLTGEEWEPPKEPVPHLKWSQPPIEIDPSISRTPIYCGWDELSYNMDYEDPCGMWKIVADDFRCLGTMPVSSVHWWGSHIDWNEPCLPAELPSSWLIGFWSNVPANPDVEPSYSYPNVLLWQIEVDADRVDCEWVGYDQFPERPPEACFQYYVKLEPEQYFWQADFVTADAPDDIFWISIIAIYPDLADIPNPWGWKTRPWHWMDDAVTFNLHEPPVPGFSHGGPQNIAPVEDALVGGYMESYDVAFELDTEPNWIKWEQAFTGIRDWPHYEDVLSMAKRIVTVNKWEQQPSPTLPGLHAHDWLEIPGGYRQITLADDWECRGGDVTDLHWYGNYELDAAGAELRGAGIDYFKLSIHDCGGGVPWCLPMEPPVLEVNVPFPLVNETDTGLVNNEGCKIYKYEYYLPVPFLQEPGMFYWFDITAVSVDAGNPAIWRWQEASRSPVFLGHAPAAEKTESTPWRSITWPTIPESYSDMAFAVTSEEQAPEPNIVAQVADDWLCERRTPVTAAAWWGSYIDYTYEACQGPPASRPVKPDYFLLSIWSDVPAGVDPNMPYSHPNDIIWEYKARDYDEVLVGYDKLPLGSPREPVFRYSVRLPEEEWFWQEDVNTIYWFSVVAVYDQNQPNYDWGWTNHEHEFNDDAVTGYLDPGGTAPEWYWSELYDETGASEDMSFILFTDPNECNRCADYNSDTIVNFIDYAYFADDWRWAGPAGGYNNSDLNCDGLVDFKDLKIFADQWLGSCP